MRRVFTEWGITGVIDAGANAGQFYRFLRCEVDFAGPVLSIEPAPDLAQHLVSQSHALWRVEAVAVGRAESYGTLQVASGSEFNSLRTPRADSDQLFHGQSATVGTANVRITTLDALLDTHGSWLGERVYLKLDTQGFDLEALAGLDRGLGSIAAAQCEAAFVPIYHDAPLIGESVSAFQTRGFILSNVFPNNGGHFPKLIEVDCFFVKESMRLVP